MSRKNRGPRSGSEAPVLEAAPGDEGAEPEALAAEGALEFAIDADAMAQVVAVAEAAAPPPREPGALPGSLRCVVSHGTVRRSGTAYAMGDALDLPRGEAEALVAAGVVVLR